MNNTANKIPMKWHKDYSKRGETGCPLCGKDLKVGAKRSYIHVVDGGASILASGEDQTEASDDMGWFEIGSSCAKKLGPAWTRKLLPTT